MTRSPATLPKRGFGAVGRRPVSADPEAMIRIGSLGDLALPKLVEPAVEGVDLVAWAKNGRELLEKLLLEHRALLFRGFGVSSADELDAFVKETSDGNLLEYRDRSSPRHEVWVSRIYTSTDYPADREIFMHNEGTYWPVWPRKIYFSCMQAAEEGGETPIADCRPIFAELDPAARRKFLDLGVLYVRNFNEGFGLTWQEVFCTDDKAVVEEYAERNDIRLEWKSGDRLRTAQRRSAVVEHPHTGETLWFNHATFFHPTTLDPETRETLLENLAPEDFPYRTFYGDGSPIEDEVLEQLRHLYREHSIAFPWQEGDVLLLDNPTVAHGRRPFTGEREVIVAMADPVERATA